MIKTGQAYELIRETFLRKPFIWGVHLAGFAVYALFWLLFLPSDQEAGMLLYYWGGFFLPLALTAGIFGDDIASGRISVLVTRPIELRDLYLYRLLGLSLQGAVHLLLAGGGICLLDICLGKGTPNSLGLWLWATWLLFNTCAALSTTLSVLVRRSYNALLVLALVMFSYFLLDVLWGYWLEDGMAAAIKILLRHVGPPFSLLRRVAHGDYGKFSLSVGKYSFMKIVACSVHCVLLTSVYALIGIQILTRRQFYSKRD
jgi:hypothetical protein